MGLNFENYEMRQNIKLIKVIKEVMRHEKR